ncbi:hypothetical protein AGMMS50230_10910 [Spirochaetia bacterium]|nr:hypothetical protein AGMMS50230_10910 [Spirochaetia bacterium]
MEMCLNELSLLPNVKDKHEAHVLMKAFAETAKHGFNKGLKKIRTDFFTSDIKLCLGYSLHDWLFDREFTGINRNYRDFLQSMLVQPFIKTSNEDEYLLSRYFFQDSENNIGKAECLGLAAAYIAKTLSISFKNGDTWKKTKLDITVETNGNAVRNSVTNVYSSECFLNQEITSFIAENMLHEIGDSYLVKTKIAPHQKDCHIRDDHGKKELAGFWELLKYSPYIESATSTNFSPKGSKFIRNVEPDKETGIILLSKDPPFTIRIKTTGRCFPETNRIAQILEKEYFLK